MLTTKLPTNSGLHAPHKIMFRLAGRNMHSCGGQQDKELLAIQLLNLRQAAWVCVHNYVNTKQTSCFLQGFVLHQLNGFELQLRH